MQMEYRFSLTPRMVALGLFSLLALFVLLFLLGLQVGQRTRPVAEVALPAAAEKAIAGAEKQAADAEAAARKKVDAAASKVDAAAGAAAAVFEKR